jgi:hypothetical protein
MFVYYDTKTKEVFATRDDGIELPSFGALNDDYKIVEILDYTQGMYTVDDSTSPVTLIPIPEV